MDGTQRRDAAEFGRLPEAAITAVLRTCVSRSLPGPGGSTSSCAGVRGIGILAVAGLVTIVSAACLPSGPPTLCERIAVEESAVLDALFGGASDEGLTPEQLEALTLRTIPTELQTVMDYREYFIGRDHPLVDGLPGTEMDPLESLDGCWGRVELEALGDDGSFEWVVAEARRIDLSKNTLDQYIMKGVDGTPCFVDSRPIVQTFENTVVDADAARMTIRIEAGMAAGQDEDDALSLHELGVRAAAESVGYEYSFFFSVQGDYLITSEEQYDPQEPLRADIDYWLRFECPE